MAEETDKVNEVNQSDDNGKKKSSNSGVWILITILALLGIGVLGFLYAKKSSAYNDCVAANTKMKQEMDAMNQALGGYIDNTTHDLRKDFKSMLSTYDALIKQDSTKGDSLIAQRDSIQNLLSSLKDTRNRSYYQISRLKKKNDELHEILGRYLKKYDSINTVNVNLNQKLDVTSSNLEETSAQRDKLLEQNKKNSALLTKGAKLNAFNFKSEALHYRSLGSGTKDVTRAKHADVLSSSFTIGANKIAGTGDKFIYMQIIDPNGQVLYKRPTNVTEVAGGEILYTGKRKINYQGQNIDMTIVFNLEGKEISSGNYIVKIYADGALIGKDTFTLK